MAVFTYRNSSIRAVVTYTSAAPKDLEIQVGHQRFKYGELASYNFPAPSGGETELTITAFVNRGPEEAEVREIASKEDVGLYSILAPHSAGPDAYVLLVPYQ